MAAIPKKVRVASNPARSKRKNKSSRPSAAKKGTHMAKAARKKPNGGGRKKPNTSAMHHKKRRRHNPSGLAATIGSPKDLVTGAVAGLASAVATRQVPQMILGAGNTSWEGYGANLVTAIAATWAAGTFGGPAAGRGALIGGMVIVLDRVLSEQISPISSYLSLSGVGDANAYSKLGTIRQGYYSHPNLQNPDGSMYIPDPFNDAAVQAVVAKYPQLAAPIMQASGGGGRVGAVNPSALRKHTANGMLLSSRFQGRFNQ
jgi:hypothetical protein